MVGSPPWGTGCETWACGTSSGCNTFFEFTLTDLRVGRWAHFGGPVGPGAAAVGDGFSGSFVFVGVLALGGVLVRGSRGGAAAILFPPLFFFLSLNHTATATSRSTPPAAPAMTTIVPPPVPADELLSPGSASAGTSKTPDAVGADIIGTGDAPSKTV